MIIYTEKDFHEKTRELLSIEFSKPIWEVMQLNAAKYNMAIGDYISMWIDMSVNMYLMEGLKKTDNEIGNSQ